MVLLITNDLDEALLLADRIVTEGETIPGTPRSGFPLLLPALLQPKGKPR